MLFDDNCCDIKDKYFIVPKGGKGIILLSFSSPQTWTCHPFSGHMCGTLSGLNPLSTCDTVVNISDDVESFIVMPGKWRQLLVVTVYCDCDPRLHPGGVGR